MPFEKVDIKQIINKKCEIDPEFNNAYKKLKNEKATKQLNKKKGVGSK